jgi:PIN domain nuclease of toxin-antitoxin system
VIHLDTHLVAWLYEARVALIPSAVAQLLEQNDLFVSPMVELELEYLFEIGRANVRSHVVIDDLSGRLGLGKSRAPFSSIVAHARGLSWTRDPFDRIIVANAMADEATLLTRDRTILDHYAAARWEGKAKPRKRPRTQAR